MALFVVAACSPATLGDVKATAKKAPLNPESYGSAEVVSSGDNLDVTLVFPTGDRCQGSFKLAETTMGFVVYGTPSLVYRGTWAATQSPACQEALGNPGSQQRKLTIFEENRGDRQMAICNEDPGKLVCLKGRVYFIPVKS
ncbi:MAG: hypothetical protein HY342_01310 [Candidatus Lambdaproteobacteria bacterium]|nr:hypothetical protein [Candidatus Lambdaproteobacteria bacterium]